MKLPVRLVGYQGDSSTHILDADDKLIASATNQEDAASIVISLNGWQDPMVLAGRLDELMAIRPEFQ